MRVRVILVHQFLDMEDEARIAGMLQGVEERELKMLGKYRAAVQRPSEGNLRSTVFIDTYPPWTADRGHVDMIKQRQTPETDTADTGITLSLGKGANSGGEKHEWLLNAAKQSLEERGNRSPASEPGKRQA